MKSKFWRIGGMLVAGALLLTGVGWGLWTLFSSNSLPEGDYPIRVQNENMTPIAKQSFRKEFGMLDSPFFQHPKAREMVHSPFASMNQHTARFEDVNMSSFYIHNTDTQWVLNDVLLMMQANYHYLPLEWVKTDALLGDVWQKANQDNTLHAMDWQYEVTKQWLSEERLPMPVMGLPIWLQIEQREEKGA